MQDNKEDKEQSKSNRNKMLYKLPFNLSGLRCAINHVLRYLTITAAATRISKEKQAQKKQNRTEQNRT